MPKHYIIIGTAAAGIGAAHKLRQLDPHGRITCISNEKETPYNKCFLADYVLGLKKEEQVFTLNHAIAQQKNITLMLGTRVMRIDRERKALVCADGTELYYDALLIGTGTSPFIPPIPGIGECAGIFTFHNLRDAHALLDWIKKCTVRHAVIIGAGLSGLECADALRAHGIRSHIVEAQDRVLPAFLDAAASNFLQTHMHAHNVDVTCGARVQKIIHANGRVAGVQLSDGTVLPADMVICAAGLRPNLDLAKESGLALVGAGISVNEHMQTNDPAIYAAGDVVMVPDQLTGNLVQSSTWPDAMLQGMIAACAMTGNHKPYPGICQVISSSFFGLNFATAGTMYAGDVDCILQRDASFYHAFATQDALLVGFLLLGNTQRLAELRRKLLTRQAL